MGNCLVTKLKGVVDNDNLLYFGYFEVKVIGLGEQTRRLEIIIGAEERLEIILRDFTINNLDRITVAAGELFRNSNKGNWVKTGNNPRLLIPKYAHYHSLGLPCGEYKTDDFAYLKCARGFNLGGDTFNVIHGNLANMLKMFEGTTESPTGLYFNMNVSANNPSFEGCDISFLFSRKVNSIRLQSVKGVIGNMDNIGKSVDTLTMFQAPDDKRLTLSIENMVGIARAEGFTTGSLNFIFLGWITTTFNGSELDKSRYDDTITWTATTITVRDVTIEA